MGQHWQEIWEIAKFCEISSNNMKFRLTRTYKSRPKCEEVVCNEHVREPRIATAILFCSLHFAFCILHFAFCILHFAFCILHFTKFAGGKNRLFQTHSQSRCAIVLCRVANRTPRASTALNIHMQPEMTKPKAIAFGGSTEIHIGHPS